MPRIISGNARGTILFAPKGQQTRPTADKVKEALFSILTPRLPADGFLDLYAGSGQIGLEAASRGSRQVILVEKARLAALTIRRNLEKTRLTDQVRLISTDSSKALQMLDEQKLCFDLVFLDPPYQQAVRDFLRLSPLLEKRLNPGALVILEHDAKDIPTDIVINLKLARRCQYGTTMLSFYKVADSAEQSEHANEAGT